MPGRSSKARNPRVVRLVKSEQNEDKSNKIRKGKWKQERLSVRRDLASRAGAKQTST